MQRHEHKLLVEMCSKNIYCENIKSKIQTEIKSVIVSVIKTCARCVHSMAYRNALGNVKLHGLLLPLSMLLGGSHWIGPCWSTAWLLLFCHAIPFLFLLSSLVGATRFGVLMRFTHVHGSHFMMLHLGLSAMGKMPLHLPRGVRGES